MQPTGYPSTSKYVGELKVAVKLVKRLSIEPVFGLSILGYCRKNGGATWWALWKSYIDIKGSF